MDTACRANALGKGKCGLVAVSTIPGAGLGLFSVKHYEKSDIICIYGGEYIQSGKGGQYVLELTNSLSVDARDEQSFHHRDLERQRQEEGDVVEMDVVFSPMLQAWNEFVFTNAVFEPDILTAVLTVNDTELVQNLEALYGKRLAKA